VFEALRRAGGRAASEITPAGRFDHGAQYFTAQSAEFEGVVAGWIEAGVAERWTGQVIALDGERTIDQTESAKRYVMRDGMQTLARRVANDVEVRLDASVSAVARRGTGWEVRGSTGAALSPAAYDAVIVAVPQAAELLREAPALAQRAERVVWQPCWAALLAIERPSGFEFGGAFVNDHAALAWAAREIGRPATSSGSGERWVLHATPRWSALHLNHAAEDVAAVLAESFAQRFNFGFHSNYLAARRWLTALPSNPLKQPFLWDQERRIGAAGDWCGGEPRIETAFLSGRALAAAITA
jgi:predicted NAD/FAD-dependent oxidoreductase